MSEISKKGSLKNLKGLIEEGRNSGSAGVFTAETFLKKAKEKIGIKFVVELIECSGPDNIDMAWLTSNCQHVYEDYWIFKGDQEFIEPAHIHLGSAVVPSLGGMSEAELIAGCKEWFGFDVEGGE